jgi:hypothetical protein
MPVTLEEEVVLLYTLYACGRKPSKARATHFILSNHLMKEREGDTDIVTTRESRIENRIAWTRENLKIKHELSMLDRGTWAITHKGVDRIEKVALRSLNWEVPDDEINSMLQDIRWDRFSGEFLRRLKALGADLKQRREQKAEQEIAPNSRPSPQCSTLPGVQSPHSRHTSSSGGSG